MRTTPAWHGLVIVGLLVGLFGIGIVNTARMRRRCRDNGDMARGGELSVRIFGFALVRADRLSDEYWRGFRLGHRTARCSAVAILRRPVETGDTATAVHILDDLARRDPTALDSDAAR